MGSSGKSNTQNQTMDYYGNCAGVICQGQFDFVWGLLVDNNLAWPDVEEWDANANNNGAIYIWTDGNAYQVQLPPDYGQDGTGVNPPAFPWVLYATPYAAGNYNAGTRVVYNGSIWTAIRNTSESPPATATPWNNQTVYAIGAQAVFSGVVFQATAQNKNAPPMSYVTKTYYRDSYITTVYNSSWEVVTNDWAYGGTPTSWLDEVFWPANSVVAWEGLIWETPVATSTEPGQPGATWVKWKVNRTDSGTFTIVDADDGGQVIDNTYTVGNPLMATAVNYGPFFIYWGTPNQQLDTSGNETYLTSLSPANKLPMRNKAIIVLGNSASGFDFGTERTTPPSIQVLGGRNPVQSLIVGDAAVLDGDWQANPWVVLAEILTHPVWGLGLPLSWFNQAAWQAEANFCYENTELYYISPLYTDLKKVREIVQDLLGYPDAFLFWNTLGELTAGHWPHGTAPPAWTALNTIDRDDCTEEIAWDSDLWGATSNSVSVSYQDVQTGFRNRPIFANNMFNANVVKQLQEQRLDRPYIVRYAQAVAWATEMSKLFGDQTFHGELTIQAEKAAGIQPGSIFLLTDDVLGLSAAMRCTRVQTSAPPSGIRKITYETERGISPQPYSPTSGVNNTTTVPSPSLITNFMVFQLPAAIANIANSLSVIAGRNNATTTFINVFYQSFSQTAYTQLGTMKAFAVPGNFDCTINNDEVLNGTDSAPTVNLGQVTKGNSYPLGQSNFWRQQVQYANNVNMTGATTAILGTDYLVNPSAGEIVILKSGHIATNDYVTVKVWNTAVIAYDTVTPQLDLDNVTGSITPDQFASGAILLIAFQANNPSLFEVMFVGSVTAGGNGANNTPVWIVQVMRAQFGTLAGGDGQYVWGTNTSDPVFMIPQAQISQFFTQAFSTFAAEQSYMAMLLVPGNAFATPDVSDVYDVAQNPGGLVMDFMYEWTNPLLPQVTWNLLLQNGDAINFAAATFVTSDVLSFNFTMTDIPAKLTQASLVALQGQQQVTLWSSTFAKTASQTATVNFSLPQGTWQIQLRMTDSSGNSDSFYVEYGGTAFSFWVNDTVAPVPFLAGGINAGTYWYDFFLSVPAATGQAVYYQIQNTGTNYSGADWIACSESGGVWSDPSFDGFLAPVQKGQTVYVYSTATGLTNSAVASWSF